MVFILKSFFFRIKWSKIRVRIIHGRALSIIAVITLFTVGASFMSFRIVFDNNEQCLSCSHHLTQCISPLSRIEDLFAFAFYAWCTDNKQSNSAEEGEFTSFCQRGRLILIIDVLVGEQTLCNAQYTG